MCKKLILKFGILVCMIVSVLYVNNYVEASSLNDCAACLAECRVVRDTCHAGISPICNADPICRLDYKSWCTQLWENCIDTCGTSGRCAN